MIETDPTAMPVEPPPTSRAGGGPTRTGCIAAVLADALATACADRTVEVDPRLRLLALASGVPSESERVEIDGPADLGRHHEALVDAAAQTERGAWYTPEWLARRLVAEAVTEIGRVADPACGGGIFLLAAADRLEALGASPARIVGELVWGADIDPLAVAVTEAALWLWSVDRGEPALASTNVVVGDALVDQAIPPVDVIVGNPPFLGQLRTATATDAARRGALQRRFGAAVQAYTDASWLFLLASVEAVRPGGSVTLVQPTSLLGARDADAIRRRIDATARIEACWIDDGTTFAAAVVCCAPRLRVATAKSQPVPNDWQRPLVDALGIPPVCLAAAGTGAVAGTGAAIETVADRATVLAGFRDEYYGLVPATVDGGAGLRLVTSGLIDPLRLRDVPTRFAKRAWDRPTIDVDALEGRAAAWVAAQRAPKLIVASQTRVLEAVVDADGELVAGVPAIVVVPHDPDDLWRLAAALHAPAASAWMAARTAGTALASDACRPTAALVGALPLPVDEGAWNDAAARAERLAGAAVPASDDDDGRARLAADWDGFAHAADRAYGIADAALRAWWKSRLPLR